jgi:hypothetical protein
MAGKALEKYRVTGGHLIRAPEEAYPSKERVKHAPSPTKQEIIMSKTCLMLLIELEGQAQRSLLKQQIAPKVEVEATEAELQEMINTAWANRRYDKFGEGFSAELRLNGWKIVKA